MKTKNILLLPVSLLVTSIPGGMVFAVEDPDAPRKIGEIFTILQKVSVYLFPIAALICFIFIVVGGYMWIVAAGDPSRIKQAQGTLTWAIIGLVLTLLSIAIVEVIKNSLGV